MSKLKRLGSIQHDEEQAIDVSPLIDMVFILLIFFMVSTTFVQDHDLSIERPRAASAQRASSKALRVFVDAKGNIQVEGQTVRPWMLQNRMRQLMRNNAEAQVLVVVDQRAPVDKLIETVDQCRLAGAEHVGVATETEAG